MKLKIMRMSGRPVDPADMLAYEDEFKANYDSTIFKHAKLPQDTDIGNVDFRSIDMLAVQEDLAAFDKVLSAKYKLFEEIKLPTTRKAWATVLSKYDSPVMMAQSSENTKEYVLVIMDNPLG